ncbi:TGS domain-containing protein, partial [Dialister invisus]
MITIRLKDGKELHFENEVTLFEAAKKISNSLAKDVLVAKVDGELTDIRNNIT